jgi:riboflavin-specific deaminase-like protein
VTAELPTLAQLRAARAEGTPLVVGQLGQSLDGRIATPSGHSHYVNGREAIALLHRLRASVDAVVVGAGTARADDPQLTVRHCPGPHPARVLVDRRRSAGPALRMLRDDGVRRIVFGHVLEDDPPGVEVVPVAAGGPSLAPAAIVSALAGRGLTRILVEGGASTVSAFLAAGTLDRLCVLVAPLIIGCGPVGLNLPPIDTLQEARRPPASVAPLADGDVVFDCDLSALRHRSDDP